VYKKNVFGIDIELLFVFGIIKYIFLPIEVFPTFSLPNIKTLFFFNKKVEFVVRIEIEKI
jgi:hypothetical protein